ncbi:MAG: FAD-binding protein [Hyphomicrobiales bacterium]
MASVVAASTAEDVRAAIADCAAAGRTVEIVSGGSKRGIGRLTHTDVELDVSALSGVVDYEPDELVIVAKPGTPVAAIEETLANRRQVLAFEPPNLSTLLGVNRAPTIGGIIASNLAGPRRVQAGAPRDHFLGFEAVSGEGTAFQAGGRVMKNVTGYDLPKLLAGSWGTLAVLTQVNLRTAPMPETEGTLVVAGLDPAAAMRLLTRAMQSPAAVSGAAYITAAAAATLDGAPAPGSLTCLRLEGTAASVKARLAIVRALADGAGDEIAEAHSRPLWRAIRDGLPLARLADHAVWRVHVEPSLAANVATGLSAAGAKIIVDWAGGLLTVALPEAAAGNDPVSRELPKGRGHAILVKATETLRQTFPVFSSLEPAVAALSARVKAAFDPKGILNPGRLYDTH